MNENIYFLSKKKPKSETLVSKNHNLAINKSIYKDGYCLFIEPKLDLPIGIWYFFYNFYKNTNRRDMHYYIQRSGFKHWTLH